MKFIINTLNELHLLNLVSDKKRSGKRLSILLLCIFISSVHNVAHPGVEATVRLVSAKFCWPKMAKQIRLFAQQCIACQKAKVSTHIHLAPTAIPVPQRRFEHLHVDLVGPLPNSAGFSYLFTVVDRTTRWPEAIPLLGITAAECAAALFTGWIQRFGVPAYLTSDRGAQFTS